jgi:hypothetical protein
VTALTEGTDDAHSTLRRIYLDEAQPPSTRASINFEKSRLESVPPALELTAAPVEDLATIVERQRARVNRILALPLETRSRMINGITRDGNGDDSSND